MAIKKYTTITIYIYDKQTVTQQYLPSTIYKKKIHKRKYELQKQKCNLLHPVSNREELYVGKTGNAVYERSCMHRLQIKNQMSVRYF